MSVDMRGSVIPRDLFIDSDSTHVAKSLLGKILCVRQPDGTVLRARITETEAYLDEDDSAAHARFGRTDRNRVLYMDGGRAYVYRCYMWWLLNLTVGPVDVPECVLIRGVEGADGPGKAARLMGFSKGMYSLPLVPECGIWVEDDGQAPGSISEKPRVGIPYASEKDRFAPLNYSIEEKTP